MKIIIDTETTGLDTMTDEILELCIIDRDAGEVLYNQRFRPVRHESWPAAQLINRISPDDVAECPTFAECRDEIQREWIRGADWVGGWNVSFDITMLENEGLCFMPGCAHDVMKDDAELCGEYISDRGPKWRKLIYAAQFWGWYPAENMAWHTAYTDCLATRAIYKCIESYKSDPESTYRELVQIRAEMEMMQLLLVGIYEETNKRILAIKESNLTEMHDMCESMYKYRVLLEQRARRYGVNT